MSKIIKTFADNSYLEYDRGKFDDWCVYYSLPNGTRKPPHDTEYFSDLKNFSNVYGVERLYNDFVKVYDLTKKDIDGSVLKRISKIALEYDTDALKIDIIFSILYMAMIAEERKKNTRLGKRIKRLGIHMLLIENQSVFKSANFMRGMKWIEIDKLCRERGF